MNLSFRFENLGLMRQADLALGDLTIVCGKNNTNKTYATYAIGGFLHQWHSNEIATFQRRTILAHLPPGLVDQVMEKGTITVPIRDMIKNFTKILKSVSDDYSNEIHRDLAANPALFRNTKVEATVAGDTVSATIEEVKMGGPRHDILEIKRGRTKKDIQITLLVHKESNASMPKEYIEDALVHAIWNSVFKHMFPKPFIASAERTGAAIFQRELDLQRNQLVEVLTGKEEKDPPPLHGRHGIYHLRYPRYPMPVRKNVDFIRDIPNIVKRESFLTKEIPQLLKLFKEIIGGAYEVTDEGVIQFVPSDFGERKVKLGLTESSSAVRSLLDVGFYLRHTAQPNDILIIDEPELNLHLKNQRLIARLLAALVNHGIKVFVTTHSDYIIKELNMLIMLNAGGSRLNKIMKKNKYEKNQLLSPDRLKVYIAEVSRTPGDPKGARKQTAQVTLKPADVNESEGIEVRSFDNTIEEMHHIQDEILWTK